MSNTTIKEPVQTGQPVPDVTFKTRTDEGWLDVSTEALFKGRNVVVFSLPGAFTPTCSATHLPRYEELAPVFAANGVDEIVCVSVNDGFVMHAWAKDQAIEKVRVIADGNGHFTDGMGMLVDKEDLGFGKRSWRYSMLVKDGVVDKMFVEPDLPGDPFTVSDADTMLAYINADARAPEPVAVISRVGCPHCQRAKDLLTAQQIRFTEIIVGRDIDQTALRGLSGSTAVPQVFMGGRLVGGADQLAALLAEKQSAKQAA